MGAGQYYIASSLHLYRPQRDSHPVPPGSESTTLPMSYPRIYIPLSGPPRGPAGTLPMPCWCPPDIPYTLRPPVGSLYILVLGIPTGTVRAPVTFSENEDKSPLIADLASAGNRQDSDRVICKTRFDHDQSAWNSPGT